MGITFDESQKIFHLDAGDSSYCCQVSNDGYLAHLYWGKRIRPANLSRLISPLIRAFAPNPDPINILFSLDTYPREYPAYGNTDFRHPVFQVQLEDGSLLTGWFFRGLTSAVRWKRRRRASPSASIAFYPPSAMAGCSGVRRCACPRPATHHAQMRISPPRLRR